MSHFHAQPKCEDECRHNNELAAATVQSCPKCGSFDVRVYAAQMRATRQNPCRLLGVQVLCRCQGDFTATYGASALIEVDSLVAA